MFFDFLPVYVSLSLKFSEQAKTNYIEFFANLCFDASIKYL